ncbi:N-acetyltransferase [Paracoccus sp. 11-3]|uniref:N-acetyltransferase n=1 Tax=Paracoccus amoyensis TaxID=2760093 RepID=A0A926JBV1_9RHOB|nr:N-acetyltransferase [Paracoccus amoyensis]
MRSATPLDAESVAEIWNAIIRDTVITFWPTERSITEVGEIIADRIAKHAFYVAVINDRVIGFAAYKQFRDGGGYRHCMEHTVYIAPEAKGVGAGRALMRAIEDHARQAGHRVMIGAVTGTNDSSIRFHRKMGYSDWGRVPDAGYKFGEYHDVVLMGRKLTE